jgi:hypothetical protein
VEGAPASDGTCDWAPPPEEDEHNNETQRSEVIVARAGSLGVGGGTPRNVLDLAYSVAFLLPKWRLCAK